MVDVHRERVTGLLDVGGQFGMVERDTNQRRVGSTGGEPFVRKANHRRRVEAGAQLEQHQSSARRERVDKAVEGVFGGALLGRLAKPIAAAHLQKNVVRRALGAVRQARRRDAVLCQIRSQLVEHWLARPNGTAIRLLALHERVAALLLPHRRFRKVSVAMQQTVDVGRHTERRTIANNAANQIVRVRSDESILKSNMIDLSRCCCKYIIAKGVFFQKKKVQN